MITTRGKETGRRKEERVSGEKGQEPVAYNIIGGRLGGTDYISGGPQRSCKVGERGRFETVSKLEC